MTYPTYLSSVSGSSSGGNVGIIYFAGITNTLTLIDSSTSFSNSVANINGGVVYMAGTGTGLQTISITGATSVTSTATTS